MLSVRLSVVQTRAARDRTGSILTLYHPTFLGSGVASEKQIPQDRARAIYDKKVTFRQTGFNLT
jgi:hypothetical protein